MPVSHEPQAKSDNPIACDMRGKHMNLYQLRVRQCSCHFPDCFNWGGLTFASPNGVRRGRNVHTKERTVTDQIPVSSAHILQQSIEFPPKVKKADHSIHPTPPLGTVDSPDPPVSRPAFSRGTVSTGTVSTGTSMGELPWKLHEIGRRPTLRTGDIPGRVSAAEIPDTRIDHPPSRTDRGAT